MKSRIAMSHRQKLVRLVTLLVLILPAVSLPAGTQADAAKAKPAQAVLRIQVQVVPVSQLPAADQLTNPARGAVVYNIPTNSPQMDVIKETRPMPLGATGVSGASAGRDAWLETTTVVPR